MRVSTIGTILMLGLLAGCQKPQKEEPATPAEKPAPVVAKAAPSVEETKPAKPAPAPVKRAFVGEVKVENNVAATLAFEMANKVVSGEMKMGEQMFVLEGNEREGMRIWIKGAEMSGYLIGKSSGDGFEGTMELSKNGGEELMSGTWNAGLKQ
jgi:hypothetical protein